MNITKDEIEKARRALVDMGIACNYLPTKKVYEKTNSITLFDSDINNRIGKQGKIYFIPVYDRQDGLEPFVDNVVQVYSIDDNTRFASAGREKTIPTKDGPANVVDINMIAATLELSIGDKVSKPLSSLDELKTSGDEDTFASFSQLDFACIFLRLPNSNKAWLNNLIKTKNGS